MKVSPSSAREEPLTCPEAAEVHFIVGFKSHLGTDPASTQAPPTAKLQTKQLFTFIQRKGICCSLNLLSQTWRTGRSGPGWSQKNTLPPAVPHRFCPVRSELSAPELREHLWTLLFVEAHYSDRCVFLRRQL